MKFTITIDIKKSAPAVFRYIASPLKLAEWTKDCQSVKTIKGRRNDAGHTSKIIMKDAKSTYSIEEEVLMYQRNQRFKIILTHKELTSEVDYLLEKVSDEHTKLHARYNIRFTNFLNRIFSSFFKIPIRNQQTEDLRKLKRILENH